MVVKRRILVGLLDGQPVYKIAEPAIFRVSNKGSKDVKYETEIASSSATAGKGESGDKVRIDVFESERRSSAFSSERISSQFSPTRC